MKLISVCQVWYDVFYENCDLVFVVVVEKVKFGKWGWVVNEMYLDCKDINGCFVYMLVVGLVMVVIGMLLKLLQYFGYMLYLLLVIGDDVVIVYGLVWIGVGFGQFIQCQVECVYWMVLVVINLYKWVVNGWDMLGLGEVCLFIEECLGCCVDFCNWVWDYVVIWECLVCYVDKLDVQVFRLVVEVVVKQSGLWKGLGWCWLQEDCDIVVEQCVEFYFCYCEQMQECFVECLCSMFNQ